MLLLQEQALSAHIGFHGIPLNSRTHCVILRENTIPYSGHLTVMRPAQWLICAKALAVGPERVTKSVSVKPISRTTVTLSAKVFVKMSLAQTLLILGVVIAEAVSNSFMEMSEHYQLTCSRSAVQRSKLTPSWPGCLQERYQYRRLGYHGRAKKEQILESPSFPAPALPNGFAFKKRDVCYSANPLPYVAGLLTLAQSQLECDFTHGIAYVGPTAENIQHLRDEGGKMCVAESNTCARVSYLNQSGLFFCNYVWWTKTLLTHNSWHWHYYPAQNTEKLAIQCDDLVPTAKNLFDYCQVADYYTFGIVNNATQGANYYVRIAGQTI